MKVDELLTALACMRNRLMRADSGCTPDSTQTRLAMIGYMRTDVFTNNPQAFTDYCQRNLAGPDRGVMTELLDELYSVLGMRPDTWWVDFANEFLLA